ncbi:MAG: winged helix-turn-helix transcriptional regulator [Chloroflexi bacterium]|nr:winged helix-turn-helix transcriptional regulator [Chloroflexota bacterium]
MKPVTLSADDERLIKICKALGNPIRFKMVRYMVENPQCITGEIVDFAGLAQSTVSQHLKVLRDAGIVRGEIEGPATCYCLNLATLQWFLAHVNDVARQFALSCCG